MRPARMGAGTQEGRLRTCPRSCTQHRTKSGRLAERNTFDGTRCRNCGFTLDRDDTDVKFERASDL